MASAVDMTEAVKKLDLVHEAEAFLQVARTLDGKTPEAACSIMASVSAMLGLYDQADAFIALARRHRAQPAPAARAPVAVTVSPSTTVSISMPGELVDRLDDAAVAMGVQRIALLDAILADVGNVARPVAGQP